MTPEAQLVQATHGQLVALFVLGAAFGFATCLGLIVTHPDPSGHEIEKLNRDRIALKMVAEYWKAQAEKDVQPIIIGGARDNADVQN